MTNVIPFDAAVDALINTHVTLTSLGYAEAARACGVSAPVLKLVEASKYSPPQSPQTWGEVTDPEEPPIGMPPFPSYPLVDVPDGVEVEPSEEENVVALVSVVVDGKRKIVAKVWDDGLIRWFDCSFGADDGPWYVAAMMEAISIGGRFNE